MKLENQVVSLELSQQLKALGVKQDSLFYWWPLEHRKEEDTHFISYIPQGLPDTPMAVGKENLFSAFTASELLEILPAALERTATWLQLRKQWPTGYFCEYEPDDGEPDATYIQPNTVSDNPSDALAKMLIHLIKNDLLKP